MTTMTMPAIVARIQPNHAQAVSQFMPMLVAIMLLAATAVASILVSGPMH